LRHLTIRFSFRTDIFEFNAVGKDCLTEKILLKLAFFFWKAVFAPGVDLSLRHFRVGLVGDVDLAIVFRLELRVWELSEGLS
jgi:hypothetical protein